MVDLSDAVTILGHLFLGSPTKLVALCAPAAGRFADNGDGTVTDTCTGLMWQKDTADVNGDGQVLDDGSDIAIWCDAHRIHERYGRELVSLVVLTDNRPTWRPHAYRSERWDFAHILRFPAVNVLDFREQRTELDGNPNPFALVVMAHLEAQAAATGAEHLRAKLGLIRRLYERGQVRADMLQLFRFIDCARRAQRAMSHARRATDARGGVQGPSRAESSSPLIEVVARLRQRLGDPRHNPRASNLDCLPRRRHTPARTRSRPQAKSGWRLT
jgi:hypothetical protein